MTIDYGFEDISLERAVVTVGSFDGVHAGHRILLQHLCAMARRLDAESVVVTFEPHPRIAMGRGEGMGLLTTVEERALLLERCGVDRVVIVHFDEEFRNRPYADFVEQLLVARLRMVGMVVGYNHRFGRGNEGNFESLLPLAERCGFVVERVAQYTDSGDKVSSTVIRNLLESGDMARAAEMLGHPYLIIAMAHAGRISMTIPEKLMPSDGEYDVRLNGERCRVRVAGREILAQGVEGRVVIEF